MLEAFLYPALSFTVGAILMALGGTAGSRIVDADSANQHDMSEEGLFRLLTRLLRHLLHPSTCDHCAHALPLSASIPLVGILMSGCRNPRCGMPRYTKAKYVLLEFLGGIIMVALWATSADTALDKFGALLVPFLLGLLLSLRDQVFAIASDEDDPERARFLLRRINDYKLTVGIGLTIIGLSVPIDIGMQILGIVLLGWVAWMIGLKLRFKFSADVENLATTHESTGARFLVAGMMLGGWFGVPIGSMLMVLAFGPILLSKRVTGKGGVRFLEEYVLVVSGLAFVTISIFIYFNEVPVSLIALGVDLEEFGFIEDLFAWWDSAIESAKLWLHLSTAALKHLWTLIDFAWQ